MSSVPLVRHTSEMNASESLYHRHRFPSEIISHCVWLYFRFSLSFRDVEEILAMRGVILTYETVREWCLKFGQTYANRLRHKSPQFGDRWHLDEVFLKINGRPHYQLLKGLRYVPRVIITDKLKSYGAAKAEVMPSVEHIQQKYQNNRAENSHQPTRLREKVMRRFKSAGHAQRFLSAFGQISSHFRVGRHLYSANGYREVMRARFVVWEDVICLPIAA